MGFELEKIAKKLDSSNTNGFELERIAENVQTGGSGGSGGGILVANLTWDGDTDTGTLDKTYEEIKNADFTVIVDNGEINQYTKRWMIVTMVALDVFEVYALETQNFDPLLFRATTADGYPTGGYA